MIRTERLYSTSLMNNSASSGNTVRGGWSMLCRPLKFEIQDIVMHDTTVHPPGLAKCLGQEVSRSGDPKTWSRGKEKETTSLNVLWIYLRVEKESVRIILFCGFNIYGTQPRQIQRLFYGVFLSSYYHSLRCCSQLTPKETGEDK